MKKITIALLLILISFFVFADNITATADLGFVQDFIIRTYSYQFSTDVRYLFNNKYELRLPITLSLSQGAQLYDTGLFLTYYPWKDAKIFFGLSLVSFGLVRGETTLEKNFFALNEVCLGYTFNLWKGLVLEPSLFVRDPTQTYSDEYDMLKGVFPCNRTFRFRLSAGWSFDLNN